MTKFQFSNAVGQLYTLSLYFNQQTSPTFTISRAFTPGAVLRRPYEKWTTLLKEFGFTPVEVLLAGKGFPYVVIDPNNPTLLLPLSARRYAALLQDVMRTDGNLTVLLAPTDYRQPAVGQTVDKDGFVSSPPPQTSPDPKEPGPYPRVVSRYTFMDYFKRLTTFFKKTNTINIKTFMEKVRPPFKGVTPPDPNIFSESRVFEAAIPRSWCLVNNRIILSDSNAGQLATLWGLALWH
jgi:hypothetical protein